LDITGLSYELLSKSPHQWPFPQQASVGQKRLYTDGQFATADGRARFAALGWSPVDEERTSAYPYALTTGRLRDQWHGMTRTGSAARLFAHCPEPRVEMHPADMLRQGLHSGDLVRVKSKRGELTLPARPSDQIKPLQAFIAMHWGSKYLLCKNQLGETCYGVNSLTTSSHCATSKQPELKHAAVQIDPSPLQQAQGCISACGWIDTDRLGTVRSELLQLLSQLDMAYLVPFADPQAELGSSTPKSGWFLQGRSHQALPEQWVNRILDLLGLNESDLIVYRDLPSGRMRSLKLSLVDSEGKRRLDSFCLVGQLESTDWLFDLLTRGMAMDWPARIWLQASQQAPQGLDALPRQVCNCLDVREDAILNCLNQLDDHHDAMQQLKSRLRCATQCGSCQPELQRIIQIHAAAQTVDQRL
jgi:assimilatory nitrate reductase catalytic subunit